MTELVITLVLFGLFFWIGYNIGVTREIRKRMQK